MRRLMWPSRHDDRGAVAVVVAVLFVALIGFAAISVDVGALWWDRKQLQNGADAAALAVAQDCATNHATCTQAVADATADSYGDANKSGGAVDVDVELSTGAVRVTAKSPRELWFAPVNNGPSQQQVSASAKATWLKSPRKMPAFPLAVSQCQFYYQSKKLFGEPVPGKPVIIELKSKGKNFEGDLGDCSGLAAGAAHNEVPGGFGWLPVDDPAQCSATITAGADQTGVPVPSDPGFDIPDCVDLEPGMTIILPLFDESEGSGSNAKYHIAGFAAFKVSGWKLKKDEYNPNPGATKNESHIWGEFVKYVPLGYQAQSGATSTDFGITIVQLTE